MIHCQRFWTLSLAIFALTAIANAQLTGNVLSADWRYPTFNAVIESHLVTVAPGIELPASAIAFTSEFYIDIESNRVEFVFDSTAEWTNTEFNGWYFKDANGTIPRVTGCVVEACSSGITGKDRVVTGFDSESFWIDFGGMAAGAGDFIRMRVLFEDDCDSIGIGIDSPPDSMPTPRPKQSPSGHSVSCFRLTEALGLPSLLRVRELLGAGLEAIGARHDRSIESPRLPRDSRAEQGTARRSFDLGVLRDLRQEPHQLQGARILPAVLGATGGTRWRRID